MGRCVWHGEVCNCGQGYPFTENGRMPQRCEDRTPLFMGAVHRDKFSDAKRKQYDDWVKAGMPHLDGDGAE
jgi:hypothetical protein